MGSRSRFALLVVAAVIVVMAFAVPALAASNVVKGDTQLLAPNNMVTELQSKHVTLNAVKPITFEAQWASKALRWWYDAPMAMKSGAKYTTYNTKTGQGVFYHSGQLLWVEASVKPHKSLKWQGLRVVALSKTSYQLVATVGNAAPYVSNVVVAQSTHATKITHSGKRYHVDGVQFRLTTTAATQLHTALGETVSQTLMLFDGDLYFTMK